MEFVGQTLPLMLRHSGKIEYRGVLLVCADRLDMIVIFEGQIRVSRTSMFSFPNEFPCSSLVVPGLKLPHFFHTQLSVFLPGIAISVCALLDDRLNNFDKTVCYGKACTP